MIDDAPSLGALLAAKTVSAVEAVRASIARIHELNPKLNAVVALDEAAALAAAERSDRRTAEGARLSALDGVPLTVKDNLFANGFRATWGSRLFADYEPNVDDIVVERLRAAGAIVIGKTNTPEFALNNETTNLLFGTTRNPWDPHLTPGGSSGGAAVSVATGMVPLAVGTDSGGSIRQPAGFTGILGLKPSVGRIARAFGFPPLVADFQVIGLMARTVAELTEFAAIAAGPDVRDRASLAFETFEPLAYQARPLRMLVVTEFGGHAVDPPIRESVERAAAEFANMGHSVKRASVPFDLASLGDVWKTLSDVGVARAAQAAPHPEAERGAIVRGASERGVRVSGAEYLRALDALARFRVEVAQAWRSFDVLLAPSSATLPWPADPAEQSGDDAPAASHVSMFNKIANATGYPAISVPGDPAPTGLPVGLQIVARYGEEALLLSLARQYEAAR